MASVMGKIREAFASFGMEPADLPKAFVIHEVLGVAFAATTWAVCLPATCPALAAIPEACAGTCAARFRLRTRNIWHHF